MSLTLKEKTEEFSSLLRYGNELISRCEVNVETVRPKKLVHFFMMGAVQSYSESINRLLTPPVIYDKAAEVLLRSIIENYINLCYIYSSRSQERALIFMADSIKDKIDFAQKYMRLMQKYPAWNLSFGQINSVQGWQDFIDMQEQNLFNAKKKYKRIIKKLPGLYDRAVLHDKRLLERKLLSKRKSIELYYTNYYKYFSQVAHLTMPGLEQFFNSEDSRWSIDGRNSDIERIMPVTRIIYLSTLQSFAKEFDVYDGNDFKQFRKFKW